MYDQILTKYQEALRGFPQLRRSLIGSIIKETRVDKGIRQMDFAKQIGLNEATLKSIENDHQLATTVSNLEKCAKAFGVSVDELILRGREHDPANYFIFKKKAPAVVKGIRKRKRLQDEWHESKRLQFRSFDMTPCSPPINTKKDFFVSRVVLPPKRSIEKLSLGAHHHVLGFVLAGFHIKINYAGQESTVTTNQGFLLDGFFPHSIVNEDEDNAALIYLVTRIPHPESTKTKFETASKTVESIDIAKGIEYIRKYKSDRPNVLIAVKHLSDLTDSLDHEQIAKLMKLKKGSSVIHWAKIEDLLSGVGVSMEEFLTWCHHREEKPISLATISSRAMIDFTAYHGLKIYSAVPPNVNSEYFFGELMIEGKNGGRKNWERKDKAMIAIFVEDGELEITVGKKRSAMTLLKGESIYFDGDLGYILRNPATDQVRGIFTTYPAVQF